MWLFTVAHGEQGLRRLVGHLGAAVEVRLPRFSGRRAAGGRPAGVAGEVRLPRFSGKACGQEREAAHLKKKNPPFFFLPLLHVQGRKKEEQCRSKRHRSGLLFFFFYMKRRRFRKNAPFHLSPAKRQNASICKAALNYLFFFFNCIPANFGLCPSCWPHVSL